MLHEWPHSLMLSA